MFSKLSLKRQSEWRYKKQRRERVGIKMRIPMGGCKKYRRPYHFLSSNDP
jgi:hypothetical protein